MISLVDYYFTCWFLLVCKYDNIFACTSQFSLVRLVFLCVTDFPLLTLLRYNLSETIIMLYNCNMFHCCYHQMESMLTVDILIICTCFHNLHSWWLSDDKIHFNIHQDKIHFNIHNKIHFNIHHDKIHFTYDSFHLSSSGACCHRCSWFLFRKHAWSSYIDGFCNFCCCCNGDHPRYQQLKNND